MSLTPARRPWSPDEQDDGEDYGPGPSGSGKKSRSLNCAECRRLKIKCDRKVPCNGCIKRGYPELCPDRALGGLKGLIKERDDLANRVQHLEHMLSGQVSQEDPYPTLPAIQVFPEAAPLPLRRQSMLRDITGIDALASVASRSPRVIGPEATEPGTIRASEANPQNDTGTLVVVDDGRSVYVGPSAGTQWLRDDMLRGNQGHALSWPMNAEPLDFALALTQPAQSLSYAQLHAQLPSLEEARRLSQSYFRRVAWIGTPITSSGFDALLDTVYLERDPLSVEISQRVMLQELGLVAAVLAFGTVVNMEIQPLDPQAIRFIALAQQCLVGGKFMVVTSLTGLQALSIIANALPYIDLFHRWDYAWQLWGVAGRLVQSMGLHRDGSQWSLDSREVDIRRRVFWYIHTGDILMSANWDRMTGLSTDHFDTMFPESWVRPETSFEYLLAKAACLAKEYALEDEIPFRLRCRASMKAMVSKYGNPLEAENASPAPNAADVTLVFQQHYLVLKTCSTIYALLRPYFVTALRASPADPTQSPYAAPFLAVVERSSMMVAALQSLYSLSPLVSVRHWGFWSDGLSAASCLGVICIVAPGCSLVPMAMRDFETVLSLLPHVRESMPREVARKDIDWIMGLHEKAVTAIENHKMSGSNKPTPSSYSVDRTETELNMAGWKTRLIKRANDQLSTPSTAQGDDGPLLDTNWWQGLLPLDTAASEALPANPSSVWLHQILQMPGVAPADPDVDPSLVNDPSMTLESLWQHQH